MTVAKIGSTILAESDETVVVEGNHYFPSSSINWDFFTKTEKTSVCSWKGTAEYYSVAVDGNDFIIYPEPHFISRSSGLNMVDKNRMILTL